VPQYRKPALDKFIDAQFDSARHFKRTLSYREFATAISLALLLSVLYNSLKHIVQEDWIEHNVEIVLIAIFVLVTPFNHVFYKIEHKRQNRFLGRNLQDYIFFACYAVIQQLVSMVVNGEFSLSRLFGDFIFLSIVVAGLEIILSGIKRLFKLFRWQPF
jgi:hypothetical protein